MFVTNFDTAWTAMLLFYVVPPLLLLLIEALLSIRSSPTRRSVTVFKAPLLWLYFWAGAFCNTFSAFVAWYRASPITIALPDVILDTVTTFTNAVMKDVPPEMYMGAVERCMNLVTLATAAVLILHPDRARQCTITAIAVGSLMYIRSVVLQLTIFPDPFPPCMSLLLQSRNHTQILNLAFKRTVSYFTGVPTLYTATRITCGDMMFSGHTMFILSYAIIWWHLCPRSYITWFITLVVVPWMITNIMLYQIHYTIDIMVALLVTCN